jgi:WD40 repeat protein
MGSSQPSSVCVSLTFAPLAVRTRTEGPGRSVSPHDRLPALSGTRLLEERSSLSALPPEVWARVFAHVASDGRVGDLGAAALVCRAWRDELHTRRADHVWRAVWDAGRMQPSNAVRPEPQSWRTYVAASRLLAARVATERVIRLPPRSHNARSHRSGTSREETIRPPAIALRTPAFCGDMEDALGRATAIHAFCTGPVLIGFERGLALLRSAEPHVLLRAGQPSSQNASIPVLGNSRESGSMPPADVLDVEQSTLLGGMVMFARQVNDQSDQAIVAATTTNLIVVIDVDLSIPFPIDSAVPAASPSGRPLSTARRRMLDSHRRRVMRWRIIDNFEMTDGHLVSLARSHQDNGKFILAGFSNGHVRVVDTKAGHLVHILSMRESPDLVVAAGGWIVASCFFAPISFTCWDLEDGRAIHRFDQTSVGWEEITTLAGICPTKHKNSFALWDGRASIRILDVSTGRFSRVVEARGLFNASIRRGVYAEAEVGAAAAHVGPYKLVLCADGKTCIVATSNRVLIVDIEAKSICKRIHSMRQVNEARRALLAVSTDNRLLVTAEGDMFGALGSRLSSSAAATAVAQPRLCVWDIETGDLRREILDVGRVSELSVANNTIAIISGGHARQCQGGPAMSRGDAIVFRFDTR